MKITKPRCYTQAANGNHSEANLFSSHRNFRCLRADTSPRRDR